MKKLFIASGNRHKIEELRQMLAPLGIELKSTLDFPEANEVEEDQPTLEGNALKKAKYWYEKTGLPSIADDTGLEVDALNGEPGVYSARYAGDNASYEENTRKLLKKLEGTDNRKARFRTVVALVGNGEQIFEGVCNGSITLEPKGKKGFGYDPVFMPDDYDKTFAELMPEVKNRISHRGKAMKKAMNHLREKLEGN